MNYFHKMVSSLALADVDSFRLGGFLLIAFVISPLVGLIVGVVGEAAGGTPRMTASALVINFFIGSVLAVIAKQLAQRSVFMSIQQSSPWDVADLRQRFLSLETCCKVVVQQMGFVAILVVAANVLPRGCFGE